MKMSVFESSFQPARGLISQLCSKCLQSQKVRRSITRAPLGVYFLLGNLRVTQSACYMHSLLLEFNKLRCSQRGHRLFTAFVANANELHTPNKKRKSSNPSPLHIQKRVWVHTHQASPCALRSLCWWWWYNKILHPSILLQRRRECEWGGSSGGGGGATNFTTSDEFLELETHCVWREHILMEAAEEKKLDPLFLSPERDKMLSGEMRFFM